MRFYWVKDRVQQGQFHIYWAPGTSNYADYFTKHVTYTQLPPPNILGKMCLYRHSLTACKGVLSRLPRKNTVGY